jgi:hypothetical protein
MSCVTAFFLLYTAAARADQVRIAGVRIPTALMLELNCTGDMAPRRQKLVQFLSERDFAAIDLSSVESYQNGAVRGADAQRGVVNLLWKDGDLPTVFFLYLNAQPTQSNEPRELAEAIEHLVRESFDCGVKRLQVGNYRMPADEYEKWTAEQEADIRGLLLTLPNVSPQGGSAATPAPSAL